MTATNQHTVLEINKLSIGYKSKNASSSIAVNINFKVKEGELVSLVGANGIGKSTLLRTIAGMQPSFKGDLLLDGKSIAKYDRLSLASKMSIVLTEAPVSKNLSVLEFISLGRQPFTNWIGTLSDNDKKAIEEALWVTDTESLMHRKCFELSDGQLQRVYIARAIAQDTPLIILDEPTTHLDVYHRAYVLKLLKKLAVQSKKSILFSSHEIDLAIQMSDKMVVMTPEATFFDTPAQLIHQGKFDSLFPKNTIEFDRNTGRFSIKE